MDGLKILACGDIHVELDSLSCAITLAQDEHVDLILFVGDFCEGSALSPNATASEFLEQAAPIIDRLSNTTTPIYFVLGNHDPDPLTTLLSQYSHIADLHNQRVQLNDYMFAGIEGSYFIIPQLWEQEPPFREGGFPEEIDFPPEFTQVRTMTIDETPIYIYSNVQSLYPDLIPFDVFVSHTPPLLPNHTNAIASAGLYQLIANSPPLLSISGHIHKPYTHIENLDWPNKPHQPPTTFVYLGSLRNRKVGHITLHSAKSVDVEMITLND